MESMLLGGDDSSSDDTDDEMLEEVTAGTAVPAAAAVAATVKPMQVSVPAPDSSAMSQSELSNRLKSLYSPASKAAQQQAQAPAPLAVSSRPSQQQLAPASSLSSMQQSRPNPSMPSMQQPQPHQVRQVEVKQERPSSSSEAFRPLMPNRPPPQVPHQAQQRPSINSDPFEPTPLSIMRERQQAKEAAKASAPQQQQQQQAPPHPAMRTGSSSTATSKASSNTTAQISNTSTSNLELDNKSKLEREAKARKERFLMFTRVLMKYLEQKDAAMHARAKAVIRECADKNKNKERGYESVTASMQKRLKDIVGVAYWNRAEAYLNHFLKQKEKEDFQKKHEASSSQQQQQQPQPAPVAPPKTQQLVQEEKQRQAKVEETRREIEKKKAQLLLEKKHRETVDQQRKAQHLLREQQAQAQQRSREHAMMATARKAANEPAKKKKSDVKRRGSPSNSTISTTSAAAAAATRMNPVPAVEVKEPPPREYNDLMDLVDHAVDYNWSSAALLLGNDAIGDVNLDEEQKKLLYGEREKPPLPRQQTEVEPSTSPSSRLPASMRGWGSRNVLSARGAWARVRLPEQRKQIAEAGNQVPVVAGLRLPTASQTAPESPKLTPEATWLNDEKAEEDATLALLSEGTEMYLKSILEKAITAARQRENLDGIRLWHLQHGPTMPPMSLRLGCDVKRQVAQVAGNAAKTVQRMEEALERQTNVPTKARDLTNDETLYQASSMSDLALRPKLASATEQAELNAKRSFEVFGGKESGGAPFGRVPKQPKIILGDLKLSREWNDYSHQRMGIATPHILYE
jgi:hypothetical protein